MAIEKDFFRQVMGRFATGVTVVTTRQDGVLGGMTVSAFVSLSLNPPLVLISVDRASHTLSLFRESKIFAVNFLTSEQVELSRGFAMPSQERFEHFCHAPYRLAATGSPILDGALGFVDARLIEEYPGGDHVIFIGHVEALGSAGYVSFASEEGRAQSTLVDYHEVIPGLSNGHTPVSEPAPLVYYRGRYRHLATEYEEPSLGTNHATDSTSKPAGR
jgi:flavin reductase (DIM6/NTAB) family NADH-FMN oxidoreductase RutF